MSAVPELELLDLQPVITRLEAQVKPLFKLIGTAADVAAAKTVASSGGAVAMVMILGGDPHRIQEGSGPFRQVMGVDFCVMVGVALAGPRGDAGLKAIKGPINAVRAALFGWEHPDGREPLSSAGEGLEDHDPKTGVLFYRLDFTTSVLLEKTS